jgi:hypothetical protein
VSWNLSAILICVSCMAKNIDHFFIYLLVISTSFENCPMCLPICYMLFWCLSFWALYIFWISIFFPMNKLQRFSTILWLSLFLLMCRRFLICCNHIN